MRSRLDLNIEDNSFAARLTPAARIADTLLHATFAEGGFPLSAGRPPHLVVFHGVRVVDAPPLQLAAEDLFGGTDDDPFPIEAKVRDWTDPGSQRPNYVERLLLDASIATRPTIVFCRVRSEVPAVVAAVADAVLPLASRNLVVAEFVQEVGDFQPDDALVSRLANLPLPYLNLILRSGVSRDRMWTLAGRLRKFAGADGNGRAKSSGGRDGAKKAAVRSSGSPDAGGPERLEDLPGLGEAQRWGLSLADDLAEYRAGVLPWSDIDSGVMIHGPPGTGKTLFARALAGSCGVPLHAHSIAAWQARGHLGDLLKAMRGAFDEARKAAPCILFLDELDSVGSRDEPVGDNASYQRQVINGLLECLDGLARREGIVVVGATNRPGAIDPAVLRPGRLGRHVEVPLPDLAGRICIIRHHLRGELPDADVAGLADEVGETSGASLARLVRDARATARGRRRPLSEADLHAAMPRGELLSDAAYRRLCVHEAGHVVVGLELSDVSGLVPTRARVRRRVREGGGNQTDFDVVEGVDQSRASVEARLVVLLAGMAAEEVVLGSPGNHSGGAPDADLVRATRLATEYEFSFGLGDGLHAVPSAAIAREGMLLDGTVARDRVERLLARCLREAKLIVGRRRAEVEALATRLAETSTVGFA